jgi:glycosyltransferase involved in cell wall biosynthesis
MVPVDPSVVDDDCRRHYPRLSSLLTDFTLIMPRSAKDATTQTSPCLLLHFVPMHGIGGVEVAAREGSKQSRGAIRVHAMAAAPQPLAADDRWMTEGPKGSPLSLRGVRAAIREVRRLDPPVIVCSLWRTVLAFTAMRFLFPGKKFVLFLHSSRSVHWPDYLATKWMALLAHEVWADSPATLAQRLPGHAGRPGTREISFVLERPHATAPTPIGPHFISWCRLIPEKRIDKALELIAALSRRVEGATFSIIGPDAGALEQLQSRCRELGLGPAVRFLGPQDRKAIERAAEQATFFLQLSSQEGRSMAVVEAMQLGLVPVVTPVGAIPEYCFDGRNAVIFDSIENTTERLARLLASPQEIRRLAAAARERFSSAPLYVEDVIHAAKALTRTKPA